MRDVGGKADSRTEPGEEKRGLPGPPRRPHPENARGSGALLPRATGTNTVLTTRPHDGRFIVPGAGVTVLWVGAADGPGAQKRHLSGTTALLRPPLPTVRGGTD